MAKKSKKKATKKSTKKKVAKKTKKPAKKVAKKSTKKGSAKKVAKKVAKKTAKKSTQKNTAKKAAVTKSVGAVKEAIASVAGSSVDGGASHPLLGAPAPDLALPKQNGELVQLSNLIQNTPKVVLYFYPKDDTPGCTTEACGFRDNLNRLQGSDTVVVGVSPDSPESHQKFIEKYSLNFDLLSDENKQLAEAFGVWKEKNFMGRTHMGVERSTFLFKNGRVAKVWQPVKVEGHVDDVIKNLT